MPETKQIEPVAMDAGRAPGRRTSRRDLVAGLAGHPELYLLAALIAVSIVFLAVPGIDLAVSRAFTTNARFLLARDPTLGLLRDLGKWLTNLIIVAAIATLLLRLLSPLRRFLLDAHQAAYLLAVYAIGPGLIVNAIMKNAFGRPRPGSLVEFGGTLHFSPIWSIAGDCSRNCSFPAGEGSSAAALLCLVLVAPRRYRTACSLGLLLVAAAVSADRIAFGGHFLSDVLISWLIVLLVAVSLRPLFFGNRGATIDRLVERRSLFPARKP